jgi:hypothetical protein
LKLKEINSSEDVIIATYHPNWSNFLS